MIYICFIDKKVCRLKENKQMLLAETLAVSYTLLGLYTSQLAALRSLKQVVLEEWRWTNVWARFLQMTQLDFEDSFEEIQVQDIGLDDLVKTTASSPNVSKVSSVHIDYDNLSMKFNKLQTLSSNFCLKY